MSNSLTSRRVRAVPAHGPRAINSRAPKHRTKWFHEAWDLDMIGWRPGTPARAGIFEKTATYLVECEQFSKRWAVPWPFKLANAKRDR